MNKSIRDILIVSSLIHTSGFEGGYINDEKVNECIMDMYLYMLYNGINNDAKKEEYFKKFENGYRELNEEQQEIVKQEYNNIIETQDKERKKVKKKGMRKYE